MKTREKRRRSASRAQTSGPTSAGPKSYTSPEIPLHSRGLSGAAAAVIAALLLLIATLAFAVRPVTDSDFWHHLAFGREVVHEIIPSRDLLSFTAAGRPWVSSGWIPSVIMYLAYLNNPEFFQWVYLVPLVVVIALLLFFYRRCGLLLTTSVLLLMVAAAYPRFLPRPDLASILLMVPLILLLLHYERKPLIPEAHGRPRMLLLPLLFLVWANCHMLFVVGLAIAGVFVAWALWKWKRGHRQDHRELMFAFGLSVLATLITPYGYKAYWFILENARLDNTATRINELKPLWLIADEPGGGKILTLAGAWAAACAWLLWRQSKIGIPLWRWLVVLFLVALAIVQRRQIGLASFGITALVLSGATGPAIPAIFRRHGAVVIPIGIFTVLVGLSAAGRLPMLPHWKARGQNIIDCDWFPCEAVDFLKQNPPPGNLFHDLYTGGFLAYHLAEETPVFIDGRLEVYNNGTYDDFFAPMEGRMSLSELFGKYGITSVLVDWRAAAEQSGHTAAALSDRPDWRLCWFSDHYALFVHEGGAVGGEAGKPGTGGSVAAATAYIEKHGYKYLNPLRPKVFMDALADPATAGAARAEAERAIAQNPQSTLAQKAMEVSQ